jgi:adenylate cyclase
VYAELLEKLKQAQPRAVVFDINFSEPQNEFSDSRLAAALTAVNFPVVLSGQAIFTQSQDQPTTFQKPLPAFAEVSGVKIGHVNTQPDTQGILRYAPLKLSIKKETFAPLSSVVAEQLNPALANDTESGLKLLDFAGQAGTIPTYPVFAALNGEVGAEQLKDKIVFIGATASDLRDFVYVPLRNPLMSGVEWHANVLDNLLTQSFIRPLNPLVGLGIMAAALLLLALALKLFKKQVAQTTALLILAVGAFSLSFALWQQKIAWPFLSTILLLVVAYILHALYEWFVAEQEKRKLKKTLSVYFSPSVLKLLLDHPEKLHLGGERREVTILFSDIRSFTTITETTDPEILSKLLHEYFTEMTEEVLSTDGVLDKFIGDAVMAFWGAPFDQKDQADRAVRAALGMMKRLKPLQEKWAKQGWPHVDIGIGVASGVATVGNMGSQKRFDYTVIGDSVNAAARLEGLNKEYKTHIIISQTTKDKLQMRVETKHLGEVLVKGKTQGINIYEVLG